MDNFVHNAANKTSEFLQYVLVSPVESAYQAIQSATPSTPSLADLSSNPFCVIFPTYEMIMSIISMEDTPWDDGHQCSILFLEQHTIESYQQISTSSTIFVISTVPESTHDMFYEGNLNNISPTTPPSTYPLNLELSKMCISELHVLMTKLSPISFFSRIL
jgi:hypothetical protein